jgi:hypothetical protein
MYENRRYEKRNKDLRYRKWSKVCAKTAVIKTAFSRIILSMPTFCIPGVAMFLLDRFGLTPKAKDPKTILELTAIFLHSGQLFS